jgi:hypothetical protein
VVTRPYERSEGRFSLGTGVVVDVEAPDAVVDAAGDVVECGYVGVRRDVEEALARTACTCPEPLLGISQLPVGTASSRVRERRVRGYWPVEPLTTAATWSCPTWVEHAVDPVLNGMYAAAVFPGG